MVFAVLAGCGRLGFDATGASSVDDATDGNGTGDGNGSGDGPASNCGGTVHTLVDDFGDGVTASAFTTFCDSPIVMAESGGELVVTLAANQPPERLCGYRSATTHDLRDSRIFIEVLEVPNPQAQAALYLLDAQYNGFGISREGTTLVMSKWLANNQMYLTNPEYNATQFRWWQIRESAGTTYWETSTDGTSWTVRASEPTPFAATGLTVYLQTRMWQSEPNPGVARFDNLNGGSGVVQCN